MKKIFAVSLFLAFLFFSGLASASPYASQAALNRMCSCCQIASCNTDQLVFTNPHSGWTTMPVNTQYVRCSERL